VAYLFRIFEQEDGSWSCRRGRDDLDRFGDLGDALTHTVDIASEDAPSEVFVHLVDGRVQPFATFG